MINNIVSTMIRIVLDLKEDIKLDIENVKKAEHEQLLDRNDEKLEKMQKVASLKEDLNGTLIQLVQSGEDIEQYKDMIDNLEIHLKELYELNGKLAAIVLPVKEMYKDIIDDISKVNGGALLEVHA